MKKALLLAVLGLALTTVVCTSTIRPAKASIEWRSWIGQAHAHDPLWNRDSITVFPEYSTATLLVNVHNPDLSDMNISTVKVWLDWNIEYFSPECSVDAPLVILPEGYHIFTIAFAVPPTSQASNLVLHGYVISVEEVNATTGPKQVSLHAKVEVAPDDAQAFVVYSTIQKDAQMLYDELRLLAVARDFESDEADILWLNGTMEYDLGLSNHESGDFLNAKAHYENALELLYQALSTETSRARTLDGLEILDAQADIALLQAQAEAAVMEANSTVIEANAAMRLADAAMMEAEATKMQAIAWIVFGIGFIVFGFAAVVWAYRRPIPTKEKT